MIKNNCLFPSPNVAAVVQHKPNEVVFLLIKCKFLGCSFFLYVDLACLAPCAPMKLYLPKSAISLTICAAALVPSNKLGFADCPPNTQPLMSTPETLDSAYQPPDGNILRRIRFVSPGGALQRPTVLMFPADVYYIDYGEYGNSKERAATYDLQQAGFLVFQVNHRLCPPGSINGQTTAGVAPAQTDDAKRHILAALADPRCNGSIYLIGGSAGGCLALWCGLDSATSTSVPGWDNNARLHIKAVVSLSGPTNLDNWDHPGLSDQDYEEFEKRVDKYVNLVWPGHTHQPLLDASPAYLITKPGGVTTSPPVRLYASEFDTVSYVQEDEMYNALNSIGLVTKTRFAGSYNHAYDNWHVIDPNTGNCVSTDVIAFFQSYP